MRNSDSIPNFDQDAVILAVCDPNIKEEIKHKFPYILIHVISDEMPITDFNGRLWCFVDYKFDTDTGFNLCHKLRISENTMHGHITVLIEDHDQVLGQLALQSGADDYIIGPLNIVHILDRIQSDEKVIASKYNRIAKLIHGDLALDIAAYRLEYKDRKIFLPLKEFRLLTFFMQHPDKLFTRNYLINEIGKNNLIIDERTVDVWVGRLRRILAVNGVPDPLRTVRSKGYVFDSV